MRARQALQAAQTEAGRSGHTHDRRRAPAARTAARPVQRRQPQPGTPRPGPRRARVGSVCHGRDDLRHGRPVSVGARGHDPGGPGGQRPAAPLRWHRAPAARLPARGRFAVGGPFERARRVARPGSCGRSWSPESRSAADEHTQNVARVRDVGSDRASVSRRPGGAPDGGRRGARVQSQLRRHRAPAARPGARFPIRHQPAPGHARRGPAQGARRDRDHCRSRRSVGQRSAGSDASGEQRRGAGGGRGQTARAAGGRSRASVAGHSP